MSERYTVSGQDEYDLPSDFDRVHALALRREGVWYTISLLRNEEFVVAKKQKGPYPIIATVVYNIAFDRSILIFWPTPMEQYEIRLIYLPHVKYW